MAGSQHSGNGCRNLQSGSHAFSNLYIHLDVCVFEKQTSKKIYTSQTKVAAIMTGKRWQNVDARGKRWENSTFQGMDGVFLRNEDGNRQLNIKTSKPDLW